jgi:hypothetical protein
MKKVTFFWDVTSDQYQCFRGTFYLCLKDLRELFYPEDRGSKFL